MVTGETLGRQAPQNRHCEERSDEAIQRDKKLDCFAALAMTTLAKANLAPGMAIEAAGEIKLQ